MLDSCLDVLPSFSNKNKGFLQCSLQKHAYLFPESVAKECHESNDEACGRQGYPTGTAFHLLLYNGGSPDKGSSLISG